VPTLACFPVGASLHPASREGGEKRKKIYSLCLNAEPQGGGKREGKYTGSGQSSLLVVLYSFFLRVRGEKGKGGLVDALLNEGEGEEQRVLERVPALS